MLSHDVTQGSDQWFAARLGKATASRIADITAKTKSGPAASRINYLAQLVVERMTGIAPETFTSEAMRWGTEKEPEARNAYAFLHAPGPVVEVGFVDHPRIPMAGASPDRLVGDDGLLEIKCPITATHIDTLTTEAVPSRYMTQIQWQIACTGRAWCDFVSFDPRLPDELQLFVKRVARDETLIAELERDVEAFLGEVSERVGQLTALRERRLAA